MSSDHLDADTELFRQAMRHVTPLKSARDVVHHAARAPLQISPTTAQQQRQARAVGDDSGMNAHLSDALLDPHQNANSSFRVNGLPAEALRRLRKESASIRASLDLHGFNIEQARSSLHAFIIACCQRGYKRVRVIHGQGFGSNSGTAVLKHQTRHWLTQMPEVLGYVSASPADGGEGAVLVLLRSAQKIN